MFSFKDVFLGNGVAEFNSNASAEEKIRLSESIYKKVMVVIGTLR